MPLVDMCIGLQMIYSKENVSVCTAQWQGGEIVARRGGDVLI